MTRMGFCSCVGCRGQNGEIVVAWIMLWKEVALASEEDCWVHDHT